MSYIALDFILITIFTHASTNKLDDWWECKSEAGEPLDICTRALSMDAGVLTLNVLYDGEVSANIGGNSFGKKDSSMLSPATWEVFIAERQVIVVEFTPETSSDHMLVFFNIAYPTAIPTKMPLTSKPSSSPKTPLPTRNPSPDPTNRPTPNPTRNPSPAPTGPSTPEPTKTPTYPPTKIPTFRTFTKEPSLSPYWRPPDIMADRSSSSTVFIDSMMLFGIIVVVMCFCILCAIFVFQYRRRENSLAEPRVDKGKAGERGRSSKRQDWRNDPLITPGGGEEPLLEPEGLRDSYSEGSFGYERDSLTLPGEHELLPFSDSGADFGSRTETGPYGESDPGDEAMSHFGEIEEMHNLDKMNNLGHRKWYKDNGYC